jgi:hypothetical protein
LFIARRALKALLAVQDPEEVLIVETQTGLRVEMSAHVGAEGVEAAARDTIEKLSLVMHPAEGAA